MTEARIAEAGVALRAFQGDLSALLSEARRVWLDEMSQTDLKAPHSATVAVDEEGKVWLTVWVPLHAQRASMFELEKRLRAAGWSASLRVAED